LALALLPLLSGCLGAAVIPILASGPLVGRHHVRAATPVPKQKTRSRSAPAPANNAPSNPAAAAAESSPNESSTAGAPSAPEPWQKFFAYALASEDTNGRVSSGHSALLTFNPPIDMPSLRDCQTPVPSVVIDLDDGPGTLDPQQLKPAPAGVAEGLAKLRQAGIVVLWISQLPAARAADLAQALRTSGLDPLGADQLLLLRGPKDRKQLLREDANQDVCIVAIAGDRRADFDELFDYLRRPAEAAGLDVMLGNGWFIVPPLDTPATAGK
jgi:hypothetical protein